MLALLPTLLRSNSPAGCLRLARWLGRWARLDPAADHWHLGPLAVDPAWQGRGIGSHLLNYALRHGAGDNFYLETDTPANVRFYRRFRFAVMARPRILDTPSWTMLRSHKP